LARFPAVQENDAPIASAAPSTSSWSLSRSSARSWWAAAWMRSRGFPEPPDRSDLVLVACGFAAIARFTYGWFRSFDPTTTWPGISGIESRVWGLLVVAVLFLGALAEPNMKMFWIMALLPFMLRGISHGSRPIDIERRRAAFELEQQRLREKFPVHNFPADWR
jgi:hypothetical protein